MNHHGKNDTQKRHSTVESQIFLHFLRKQLASKDDDKNNIKS